MVSSRLILAGETVAMMQVFVRPPRESCRRRVNLDSLYHHGENVSVIQYNRVQEFPRY